MFRLRELEKKDLPAINKWRNHPELIGCLGAPFRYINLEVDNRWFDNYMGNRGNAIRCSITEDGSDEVLGLVSLVNIDYMNRSAEFHIMIGEPENRGRGIGTFAVNAMLRHAFYNMNLQRVELSAPESNVRAQRLYEKCGFIKEGVKRNAKYKNGSFVNLILYSMLRAEFDTRGEIKYNLPDYSVDRITSYGEMLAVIERCDNALTPPIMQRSNWELLVRKWNAAAEFIAAYNEDFMGYISFYANDLNGCAYVTLIAVRADCQGQHIGKRLISVCEDIAAGRGMRAIKLEVRDNNEKAIGFYKKLGFVFMERASDQSFYMEKPIADG